MYVLVVSKSLQNRNLVICLKFDEKDLFHEVILATIDTTGIVSF